MTTAEELMKKKAAIKAELDNQTPRSDALWRMATDRLSNIQEKYGELPKGVHMHVNKIFPAAVIYLTTKDELGEKAAYLDTAERYHPLA